MAYQVEVTDTFGGQANYSWVRRYRLDGDGYEDSRKLVKAAKAIAGWTGVKCETSDIGDGFEVRPRGACMVLFVTWIDSPDPDETES